jgi:hypothetical protein
MLTVSYSPFVFNLKNSHGGVHCCVCVCVSQSVDVLCSRGAVSIVTLRVMRIPLRLCLGRESSEDSGYVNPSIVGGSGGVESGLPYYLTEL